MPVPNHYQFTLPPGKTWLFYRQPWTNRAGTNYPPHQFRFNSTHTIIITEAATTWTWTVNGWHVSPEFGKICLEELRDLCNLELPAPTKEVAEVEYKVVCVHEYPNKTPEKFQPIVCPDCRYGRDPENKVCRTCYGRGRFWNDQMALR